MLFKRSKEVQWLLLNLFHSFSPFFSFFFFFANLRQMYFSMIYVTLYFRLMSKMFGSGDLSGIWILFLRILAHTAIMSWVGAVVKNLLSLQKCREKAKGPCRNIAALTLWQFAMSDVWSVQISGLINLPVRAWDLKGPQPCGTALTQLVLMKFCRLENYSCQKNAHIKPEALAFLLFSPPLSQHSYIAHSPPPSLPPCCLSLPDVSLSLPPVLSHCLENET